MHQSHLFQVENIKGNKVLTIVALVGMQSVSWGLYANSQCTPIRKSVRVHYESNLDFSGTQCTQLVEDLQNIVYSVSYS